MLYRIIVLFIEYVAKSITKRIFLPNEAGNNIEVNPFVVYTQNKNQPITLVPLNSHPLAFQFPFIAENFSFDHKNLLNLT